MGEEDDQLIGTAEDTTTTMETVTKVEESVGDGSANVNDSTPAPSKKSLKRAIKSVNWENTKRLKRAAEKVKMKKKLQLARETGQQLPISRKALKKIAKPIDWSAPGGCRVAIDLTFGELMNHQACVKTIKQCLRVYSVNRRSTTRLPVYFCGLQPGSTLMNILDKHDGYQHWDVKIQPESYLEVFPKESIVYLTSDSENLLEEVDNNTVYVIGGLVDYNHQKELCWNLAKEKGIRHARLPIRENVELRARTVLTIEQVFDILLRKYNGSDWKSALMAVIPQRKEAKPWPDLFRDKIPEAAKETDAEAALPSVTDSTTVTAEDNENDSEEADSENDD